MESAVTFLICSAVFVCWVASLVQAVKFRQIGWVIVLVLFWPCALVYVFLIPGYLDEEQARLAKERGLAREGIQLRSKVKKLEAEVARLGQIVSKAGE